QSRGGGNADRGERRRRMGGTVEGFVIDSAGGQPIEYATVTLFSLRDSSQITGGVTDTAGYFKLTRLRPGRYFMQVRFVGYLISTIDSLAISRESRQVDLGEIQLIRSAVDLGEVTVSGERPAIEYKIDKKIINVSEMPTAASGTAVDVLENVPSVEVDIEGNVSLRGSANFTVLIDGRPSILESNEALQQIPAGTIENIELITNPSAKYDPDGNSGIINVIMKKDRPQGISGISNLNLGTYNNHGGDLLLSRRLGKINLVLGGNLGKRGHPGTTESENRTLLNDTTSFTLTNGDNERRRKSYSFRGAADMNISPRDYFSLGFRYGYRSSERESDLDHDAWIEPGGVHHYYTNASSSERSGDYYSIHGDYRHNFSEDGHELAAQLIRQHREGDEKTTNELLDLDGAVNSGQRSTELGPSTTYRMKLDYTLPLNGDGRFEAGYQSRIGRSDDITESYELDTTASVYRFQPEFSHTVDYTRDIHSLYSLYSGSLGRLGYQGGIRGEYTKRAVELLGEGEEFSIDRWDYYPTAHFSMQLNDGQQLMASYARRLHRSRGWYLEPFETRSDAYNVRRGNPELLPEYIDSYEAGYQRRIGGNLLSVEGYYRVTHNKVEHIRSVYEPNVMLTTIENVGTDYSLGAEFMFMLEPTKWWRLNLMGSLFDYRVEGELNGRSFDQDSFNWNMRMNNSLQVTATTRLQLDGMYRSPSASSQGEREGFFMANAAVRQDFFARTLTATLQVHDLLGTANRESTSQGADFYNYNLRERKSPTVSFNLRFNFNNYKEERSRDGDRARGSGGEGMDDNDDF
ncbi:MAG: TonB-dependent receptor, partial [candidate division Zixibacteria bacterium]|nr:TonB-dependent receptor [candidate division Zixibacteria bacterium]